MKKYNHVDRSKCPFAYTLDLIGDHWTILIIRNMLFFNQHEYKEFLAMPEKISTNILSDRLAKLLSYKVIAVVNHPHDKKRKLYYLTTAGKDFFNILIEIFVWADNNLGDVKVIEEIKQEIINTPKEFKAKYLKTLELWEKNNLS